jgi:hypothetical protein
LLYCKAPLSFWQIRDETPLAVARIEAKTTELSVKTQAMHAELVRMRTPDDAVDSEPDPPTRPNWRATNRGTLQ